MFGIFAKQQPPYELQAGDVRASPILKFLDGKAIPWRNSVRELIAQYGIANDPWYGWKIIGIKSDKPLLDGLKVALSAHCDTNLNAAYPLIYFSCGLHVSDDAQANLESAVRQLTKALGPGTDCSASNTRAMRWDDGYARIEATIWPANLRLPRTSNPAQARHPFLADACYVNVQMTYLPPLSQAERAWAASFRTLADVSGAVALTYPHWQGAQYMREFLRKRGKMPVSGRALGVSADGAALIAADAETLGIFPLARLRGSELQTIPDERGGPTTYELKVRVPKDFEAGALREVTVARQEGACGELQALAAIVAKLTG